MFQGLTNVTIAKIRETTAFPTGLKKVRHGQWRPPAQAGKRTFFLVMWEQAESMMVQMRRMAEKLKSNHLIGGTTGDNNGFREGRTYDNGRWESGRER